MGVLTCPEQLFPNCFESQPVLDRTVFAEDQVSAMWSGANVEVNSSTARVMSLVRDSPFLKELVFRMRRIVPSLPLPARDGSLEVESLETLHGSLQPA
jgi:hypothetical protein